MSTEHLHPPATPESQPFRLPSRVVFLGFALVAGFYLWTEHRAHLLGWAPYLIFALCPLLHLFHGHGGHQHSGRTSSAKGD